jgi:hypothetical protein
MPWINRPPVGKGPKILVKNRQNLCAREEVRLEELPDLDAPVGAHV